MNYRYSLNQTNWFVVILKFLLVFLALYFFLKFIPGAVASRIDSKTSNKIVKSESVDKKFSFANIINLDDFDSEEVINSVKNTFSGLTKSIETINKTALEKLK